MNETNRNNDDSVTLEVIKYLIARLEQLKDQQAKREREHSSLYFQYVDKCAEYRLLEDKYEKLKIQIQNDEIL